MTDLVRVKASGRRTGMTIGQVAAFITEAAKNGVPPEAQLKVNITWTGGIKNIEAFGEKPEGTRS